MKRNLRGAYLNFAHDRGEDWNWLRDWQPSVVRLMLHGSHIDPNSVDVNRIRRVHETAPDALIVLRVWDVDDRNHETSIRSHLETDLLERLAHSIRAIHMGYSGFVRFMFEREGGGRRTHRTLYWHHGSGGGGPVTKGVTQTNRHAASVEADIYVSGHIHESWCVENVVASLLDSGRVSLKTQTHICLPTYKDEYHMAGGYHIEKGRPPKPLGAYWLVWHYDGSQPGNVGYRVERAN